MEILRSGKRSIHKFHIFVAAVFVLKIIFMGLFSSDYQTAMFMRFINGFLEQIGQGNLVNPYEFFKAEPNLFPYPPVMLVVECVGGLFSRIAVGSVFWQNVLFKLPNLFFDCLGMYYLMVMFPKKRRYVAAICCGAVLCFSHHSLLHIYAWAAGYNPDHSAAGSNRTSDRLQAA